MKMQSRPWLVFSLSALMTQGCGSQDPSTHGRVLRMPSGDSVEVVAVGAAIVSGKPPGLLFTYHPFVSLEDTSRIERIAAELWRVHVKPTLGSPEPDFVVLQATSRRAGPIHGSVSVVNYGVVLERRSDGNWYFLNSAVRVQ